MKQEYEYKQTMFAVMSDRSVADYCNEHAKGGWRLVSITLPQDWQSWFMIFERKLS